MCQKLSFNGISMSFFCVAHNVCVKFTYVKIGWICWFHMRTVKYCISMFSMKLSAQQQHRPTFLLDQSVIALNQWQRSKITKTTFIVLSAYTVVVIIFSDFWVGSVRLLRAIGIHWIIHSGPLFNECIVLEKFPFYRFQMVSHNRNQLAHTHTSAIVLFPFVKTKKLTK